MEAQDEACQPHGDPLSDRGAVVTLRGHLAVAGALREPIRVLAFAHRLGDHSVFDCGILEHGFAHVRSGACAADHLVAFLHKEVLEVGPAQRVFSLAKMLRP